MEFNDAGSGGNCNVCVWIKAEGIIDENTPSDFKKFMGKQVHKGNIVFNSDGGSLKAGIELGKIIREYGMQTSIGKTVPDYSLSKSGYISEIEKGKCLSACSFAFLGGVTRNATGGELGVHQFYQEYAISNPEFKNYNSYDLQAQQAITGYLVDYVTSMGVSSQFIVAASNTPPSSMKYLTEAELKEFKIIIDEDELLDWEIKLTNSNKLFAVSTNRESSLEAYIFCTNNNLNLAIYNSIYNKKDFLSAFESIEGITIFGFYYEKNIIKYKASNNKSGIEIKIPAIISEANANKKNYFFVEPDGARAVWSYFTYRLNQNKIFEVIKIIRKNCQ